MPILETDYSKVVNTITRKYEQNKNVGKIYIGKRRGTAAAFFVKGLLQLFDQPQQQAGADDTADETKADSDQTEQEAAQPTAYDTDYDVAQQAALVLHDLSGQPAGQSAQSDADDGGNDEIHGDASFKIQR